MCSVTKAEFSFIKASQIFISEQEAFMVNNKSFFFHERLKIILNSIEKGKNESTLLRGKCKERHDSFSLEWNHEEGMGIVIDEFVQKAFHTEHGWSCGIEENLSLELDENDTIN